MISGFSCKLNKLSAFYIIGSFHLAFNDSYKSAMWQTFVKASQRNRPERSLQKLQRHAVSQIIALGAAFDGRP